MDNGVLVDASLRTSDPHIYAAGDVANALFPFLGKHIRVEHWDDACRQPATAARAMLGEDAVYDRIPAATSSPADTTRSWCAET